MLYLLKVYFFLQHNISGRLGFPTSSSNWSLDTSALALERTVIQVQLVFQ